VKRFDYDQPLHHRAYLLHFAIDWLRQIGVFFCGPAVLGETIRAVLITARADRLLLCFSLCISCQTFQACQEIQAENVENGTNTRFSFQMEVF
jgi:hypothetical protein